MARYGPVTTDPSQAFVGLLQVRVGASAANIATPTEVLTASDSIGCLADTKFTGNTEWLRLESGWPKLLDTSVPLSEAAALEGTLRQLSPANIAMAYGLDPVDYTEAHSGEIKLGGKSTPQMLRVEAVGTFNDKVHTMTFIFPRAQAVSSCEIVYADSDWAGVPFTLEANNSSSDVTGGNAVWDNMPLGRIVFA